MECRAPPISRASTELEALARPVEARARRRRAAPAPAARPVAASARAVMPASAARKQAAHALTPCRDAPRWRWRRAASAAAARRRDRRSCRASKRSSPAQAIDRAIVGAKIWRRRDEAQAASRRKAASARGGWRHWRRDAAADDETLRRPPFAFREETHAGAHAIDDHVDDRRLEGGGEILHVRARSASPSLMISWRTAVLRPESEKSAPSTPEHRAREIEAVRVALLRQRARSAARRDRAAPASSPTLSKASPAASSTVEPRRR